MLFRSELVLWEGPRRQFRSFGVVQRLVITMHGRAWNRLFTRVVSSPIPILGLLVCGALAGGQDLLCEFLIALLVGYVVVVAGNPVTAAVGGRV